MPIVSSDIPRFLEAGMKSVFFEELQTNPGAYERLCTRVDTTQETQSYGWLGSVARMREFTDERQAKSVAQYGMSITDKTWEATIGVSRRAIENDNYGQVMVKVRELAREAVNFINRRALTVLREANTTTYGRSWDNYNADGSLISAATISFADTDHVYPDPAIYKSSQVNKAANALSGPNLGTAVNAMLTWKTDNYTATDPTFDARVADLLVVPPKLQWTARELLNSQFQVTAGISNAASSSGSPYDNVYRGIVDLMVAPEWAADAAGNTQNWGLCCTTGAMKPLILQVFKPAMTGGSLFEFTSLEANSHEGFMRDMYYFGVRSRFEIGYGDWRNFYLNVVA